MKKARAMGAAVSLYDDLRQFSWLTSVGIAEDRDGIYLFVYASAAPAATVQKQLPSEWQGYRVKLKHGRFRLGPVRESQERRDRAEREAGQIVHDDGTRLTDDERKAHALGWRSGYNSCLRDMQRDIQRHPD